MTLDRTFVFRLTTCALVKLRRLHRVLYTTVLAVPGLRGWLDIELADEAAEMVDALVDS